MRLLTTLAALIALCAPDDAPKPVTDWLAEAKKRAPSVSELIADARIVIVGRAFDGVAELAAFEGSIATLATERDVIAIDIGYREGAELDHLLRTVERPIADVLAGTVGFGWSPTETRTWLETFTKREPMPRIAGIAVGDPKPVCTEVLAYLAKVSPSTHARAERSLHALALDGRNGEPGYLQLDDNGRAILHTSLEETLNLARESQEAYTEKSSAAEYARNLRLIVELQQYEQTMRFEREAGEHDPRGSILAANARALLKDLPKDGRLFVLAGLRDLGRTSDPDSFAARLSALSAPRALCIATACGEATFQAIDPSASGKRVPRELKTSRSAAGAFERALSEASGGARWILDLRTKPSSDSVTSWFGSLRSVRSARHVCGGAGETQWDHAVLGDFDALAWFPTGTASALVR